MPDALDRRYQTQFVEASTAVTHGPIILGVGLRAVPIKASKRPTNGQGSCVIGTLSTANIRRCDAFVGHPGATGKGLATPDRAATTARVAVNSI